MAKCIEGCSEMLVLMGIRGKKYGTSHVDNRVTKARMGYSAGNRLPLGPWRFSVSFAVYASQALPFWGIGRKLAGQKRCSWEVVARHTARGAALAQTARGARARCRCSAV
jgi:hypothetical protein